MKGFVGLILIVMIFLACDVQEKKERPIQVPKDALWKGGVDGGCWILFSSVTDTIVEATIFHGNGELWEKGRFKKASKCELNRTEIVNEISAFDGTRLITGQGCSFKKVE